MDPALNTTVDGGCYGSSSVRGSDEMGQTPVKRVDGTNGKCDSAAETHLRTGREL